MDDDADGWVDADDPDCVNRATAETGYGNTECNDGIDNNDDGAMDAQDSNCDSALDDTEMTGCEDEEDNDGDGWVDFEDPDCEEGLVEVGFGDTECNDGVDNDGDGLIDADDDQCDIAIHIKEEAPPVKTTSMMMGMDGSTWMTQTVQRVTSKTTTTSVFACNDGIDNDVDGFIDSDRPLLRRRL